MADPTPNPAPNNAPRPRNTRAANVERVRIFDAPTIRSFDGPFGSMRVLEAAVDQANLDARRLEHILITGPAGCGKQVLARAVVRELAQRAMELDGESVENLTHLMELARPLRARDVLLVRHLDQMPPRGQQHLAVMVGERRSPRAMRSASESRDAMGMPDLEVNLPPLTDFTLLATAAEPTKVLPVLRQHFELTLHLGMPNANSQQSAIRRGLAALGLKADPHAAARLVELASAHPDCTEAIVRVIVIRARAEGHAVITRDLVDRCAAEDLPLFVQQAQPPASPSAAGPGAAA